MLNLPEKRLNYIILRSEAALAFAAAKHLAPKRGCRETKSRGILAFLRRGAHTSEVFFGVLPTQVNNRFYRLSGFHIV